MTAANESEGMYGAESVGAKSAPLMECVVCRRCVLVRPGVCHGCARRLGLKTRIVCEASSGKGLLPEVDPTRAARVAEYERRAAAKLPLFGMAEANQRRSL